MKQTTRMLSLAWVLLLGGCMMLGGTGHTGGWVGLDDYGYGSSTPGGAPSERAQASSAGLTLVLSVSTPNGAGPMAIDAWLRPDRADSDLGDADVWLRIENPRGGVDRLLMQRVDSLGSVWHRALYRSVTTGVHLVTAEAQTGTGADARTVAVTATVDVSGHPHHGGHNWVAPVAILGGVGMLAMMALMMSGTH